MSYYEQPGRTTTRDKDGKTIVTVTYVGTEEAPQPTGLTGTIKNKSVTTDVAGQIKTQFQIETDAASSGDPVQTDAVTFEIVSSVRTVPIEAHPEFYGNGYGKLNASDIDLIKQTITNGRGEALFSDIEERIIGNNQAALKLWNYIKGGVQSYYEPSMVVRKTYQASSPPSSSAQVGTVASPGVAVPGQRRGSNFLLIGVSARGTAGNYTVTEEYEMSGPIVWDPFLYQP